MAEQHIPSDSDREIRLSDEQQVNDLVGQAIFGLWKIVNDLTRLKPTRDDHYRVTIFGSARVQPDSKIYEEVKRIAYSLTERGCDIITGGGPGLMQAANEGAAAADAADRVKSFGIRVDLPFEQHANPFVEQVFEHGTFFTRLHHFVLASDAFVVTPGGIGTVLETMMIWQLLQVRHLHGTPLIMVGEMWEGLVTWARESMLAFHPPMADPADLQIPTCIGSADEAIALISDHHATWLTTYGRALTRSGSVEGN